MRAKFLSLAAAALAFGMTGAAAFAQSSTSTTTTTITQGGTLVPGQTQVTTYVGRPLLDSAGNVIGTITERRDNSYIVSAGQYLGVGQRMYIVPQDKVIIQGSGPSVMITTPLTREQIVVLPAP